MFRPSIPCLLLLLLIDTACSQDTNVLLPAELPDSGLLRSWLRDRVHQSFDERQQRFEQLTTAEAIRDYQLEKREQFLESLGKFPERTPLNARTVETFSCDGYKIEKVIYESQPGFFVPALVYLPETAGPHPGVLLLCGHTENGKAGATYQLACMLLAKHGFVVLCPDPIGQGERKQILDADGPGSTSEHMICGVAPILLGRGLGSYMIWDAIRAIDYLASRDDVDAERLGCTGNSGGGNRTSYLMAIDDRIRCAAPGCFITTTRRKNDSPGPGDAEQNTFARISLGIEHADYLIMRAPLPTLINSATHDFVPIAGAWETFREAKRIYTMLGHSDRVDLVEANDKHGFSSPLRIATTQFMLRWLAHSDRPVIEEESAIHSDQRLQCTPTGQVQTMPGARSIFELNMADGEKLAAERLNIHPQSDHERRAKIRELCHVLPVENLAAEIRGRQEHEGYTVEKILLSASDIFPTPALWISPENPTELCLFVSEDGKQSALDSERIEPLLKNGTAVLAVDLCGVGETQMKPWRYGSVAGVLGPNSAEYFVAYMLGKSFVGMRAEQILASAQYLQERFPTLGNARLVADGELTVPVLHAAALEPDRIGKVDLSGGLANWQHVLQTPITHRQLENTVHGALQYYDLDDLRTMIGSARLTETNLHGANGLPLTERH